MEITRDQALAKLAETRAEALRTIDSEYSKKESKAAWFYTHMGEIEMCFYLGLITSEDNDKFHEEWARHNPTGRNLR